LRPTLSIIPSANSEAFCQSLQCTTGKINKNEYMSSNLILVVDDDEFQREAIGMQLSSLGWNEVILASSGTEALMHFTTYGNKIRAIISDLSMPDMDGLVLMRHLAQRRFQAAIILLSGVHDEILSSAAGLANAHGLDILGVLKKPSTSEELQSLLSRLQPILIPASKASIAPALTPERLKAALDGGEFIPWYQPKVDLRNGRPVGTEALARWPTPGGMIGPGQFIPAIEAAGLSDDLFFAMAQQVVTDMASWHRQNISIKTAINMSMDTALNLEVPERLGKLVNAAGLQPSDFVIEVTESRLMVERSLAMETLTRLSLMGFILSIDDFGTGYSSLVQLIDLPFKELKIDGSFVQRSNLEHKAQAIVRIAYMLGSNLGMSVIAEGVETAGQLEFLRSCGGELVQGYHYARPMPFGTCTEWLLRA
jgi:EAL domain-containing protein (putative c-di-GMP-specific phosphodiesterase class I)/ActR/RegA family two-component response regulator